MNRYGWGRLLLMGALLVGIFFLIQGLGGYLVQELASFEETDTISEAPPEIITEKRMVLRLETASYYTWQVGTFADKTEGQAVVDQLAEAGYRVFVQQGPPYKLWLGCYGQSDSALAPPEAAAAAGQDVHLVENLLNTVSLKFMDGDGLMAEQIAPLVADYDVLLKHSLKMFGQAGYGQYSDEVWAEMITQLDSELAAATAVGQEVLAGEASKPLARDLIDLGEVAQSYRQSLAMITDKKNDQSLLIAQSYLLQLIQQYHSFIEETNNLNGDS